MTTTDHPAPPDLELLERAWSLMNDIRGETETASPAWLAARDQWQATYKAYLAGRRSKASAIVDLARLACETYRYALEPTTNRVLPYDDLTAEQQAGWRAVAVAIWAVSWTAWQRGKGAGQ